MLGDVVLVNRYQTESLITAMDVPLAPPDGNDNVRRPVEGLTRAQWEQATAELRAVLGEPTRQAVEAEQHLHRVHVESHPQIRQGGS